MILDLKKLWIILTPYEHRRVILMLMLVVMMAVTETVGVISIMPFLTMLGRPEIVHEQPALLWLYGKLGINDVRAFIVTLGLISMSIVVLSSAFKTVTLHVVNRFVHFLRHSLSVRLMSRYLRQPYEFFLSRNPSELSKNVLSEADQLVFDLLQPLSLLIAQGTVVFAMIILIVAYDPMVALAIIATVGSLYGAIYLVVRRRLGRIGHARQVANTRRYQACAEALGGIKDVKMTHSADAWLSNYGHNSREFSRHSATAETLSTSPLYMVEAVGYSGLILIALFLLVRSNDIAQVLPALGLYGFATYRLLPAVQIMYRGFARLRFSSAALDNIYRDLELPDEAAPAGVEVITPQHEIRLEGIRYAYPAAPCKPVLDGIDLVIPANTSMGIVGKSGTGKSTLMDLLLGLLQAQAGALIVDGTPITAGNVGAWQRAIGYVPQNIYLADTDVAENIAFGVPREKIDMAAVERAARLAQIHDFVVGELPNGYDTFVGDRGVRLSGGQRQRIGIARALYRDPPLLFFDEATSALDAQTEGALNEAVRTLSGSKTIVIIAHKEASLLHCQNIFSLNTTRSVDQANT